MSGAIPDSLLEQLGHQLSQVIGFIYPNEVETQWAILIVVYPYLTGIVAGAFILASLVKVFNVVEVQPIYRLALLTALSFMLVAGMPLQLHLGHPERAYEIFFTPQPTSAMAMFGFVYLWYLLGILLIEIWFEYRHQLVLMAQKSRGLMKGVYGALSLFSKDVSPEALAFDHKASRIITIIGIPSAFLLHGYVGFIFGSVKANPWWGSVLMPIVFLMSAIVSGHRHGDVPLHGAESRSQREARHALPRQGRAVPARRDHRGLRARGARLHPPPVPERGVDRDPEGAGFVQVVHEPGRGAAAARHAAAAGHPRAGPFSGRFNEELRKLLYFSSSVLLLLGIFSMRWNVVIGGQLYSKSFRGLMAYKMELTGIESLMTALLLLALPFIILTVLFRLLPPRWMESQAPAVAH